MQSSIITFEKIYMSIPFQDKDWARNNGFKWDPKGKAWYLPPGKDPLPFKKYWSYLENTFHDKEELKKRGCRFNLGLKKWYLPIGGRASFDKFIKWWPESLKQFVFSEKFVIQQFISRTGQAEMFKAIDPDTDEEFAIKYFLIDVDQLSTAKYKRAVSGEVEALQKLGEHPNILKFTDWGEIKRTERRYIVSEWVKLGSLLDYIELSEEDWFRKIFANFYNLDDHERQEIIESSKNELADAWLDESKIIIGILEGIAWAHSKNIFHRDIKPGNVLLDVDLEVEELIPRLCDFGTAKIYKGEEIIQSKHTVVEFRTQPYRPEFKELSDAGKKEIHYQKTWDLFAWAILTIEVLANDFMKTSEEALDVLTKKLASELDEDIVLLLKSAMALNPSDRPQDVSEFRDKIKELTEIRKQRLGWQD